MAQLRLGLARARLGPAAALIDAAGRTAACEENRLTRARQAPTIGPPALTVPELAAFLSVSERDIDSIAAVRDADAPGWWRSPRFAGNHLPVQEIDPHAAHAEYAFRASGFASAVTLVCDDSAATGYAAFAHTDGGARRLDDVGRFPIARIYGELTDALGLQAGRDEHLIEAMARAGDAHAIRIDDLLTLTDEGILSQRAFRHGVDHLVAGSDGEPRRRNMAAAAQRRLGEGLVELLRRLASVTGLPNVCLSGGLFFNTHFTTTAAECGAFVHAYVPPHPGRSGAAVGAALAGSERTPSDVGSPYLGPGYSDPQVKEALENCKLAFDLQREEQVIDTVLRAVGRGRLVGWYYGRLEWGPRALGHRTVLADPLSPHVLENLNGYLKKRPGYRTYGVSVPATRLTELFEGSRPSPFMQYEYRPRDLERFRALLPEGVKTLRVHTVDDRSPRYLRLLERWGEMSGTPVLVNTSFNGFHEPLVCSPRDAIRVFYGTGLDLLALEDFVLRK